jgi:hypothetical protein
MTKLKSTKKKETKEIKIKTEVIKKVAEENNSIEAEKQASYAKNILTGKS